MLAKVTSGAVVGIDGLLVDVEVDIGLGLPAIAVVGLPDSAIQEAKERVRAALKNSDYTFPARRIVINLAPADIRKEGPSFDLPIALGVLIGSDQLPVDPPPQAVVMGELSLDGRVRAIHGVLPVAIAARAAGRTHLIVPADNAAEAALVEGLLVFPVNSLEEAILALTHPDQAPSITEAPPVETPLPDLHLDYRDVKGQHTAKRALMVAAAGGHNLLMIGPPGSGKTMLARRLPSILPPMDFQSALEVSKIYSIMGQLAPKRGLMTERPFRSPHHSISSAGLAGGSSIPRPGEISLAHHGVLFLDELLEFRRDVLEVLRQPLEDRQVTIARAQMTVTYPASFMLVASLNPCPCGYRGDSLKVCTCNPNQVDRYWSRLSGPMLDRMDIHLEVPRLKQDDLMSTQVGEDSIGLRERVVQARLRQHERFLKSAISANAEMLPAHLRAFCTLTVDGKNLLKRAIHQLGLSARAYDRILKVARTVADLEQSETIEPPHLAEAIQYRTLDRPMS